MYYVSRQCRWPEGRLLVEIVSGGCDHAGADMLTPRFPGEGQEYADPREAVEVAVRICIAWRAVSTRAEWPRLAYGATAGGLAETEPCNFASARKAAKAAWLALNDIATALRHKADGDEEAAAPTFEAQKHPEQGYVPPGVLRMAETLNEQAKRQRVLAALFEEVESFDDVTLTATSETDDWEDAAPPSEREDFHSDG